MRFALTIAIVISSVISAVGQIEISGPLNGVFEDTIYYVTGNISVPSADTLVIEPGARILFQGDYQFDIYGFMTAQGAENDSIYIGLGPAGEIYGGVDFYSSSNPNCAMSHVYITGADESGIDCYGSSPTISYCTIHDNEGGTGGGVYCNSASGPHFISCVISNNYASMGGGVSSGSHTAVFENCEIIDNDANYYGGGITAFGGETVFDGCHISGNAVNNNSTTAYGGGCYASDSDAIFEDCLFENNRAGFTANGVGGGIFTTYSGLTIRNCTFFGNRAGELNNGDGGALYFLESQPVLDKCLIYGNSARNYAGGIITEFSEPEIINCTIVNNYALSLGGGVFIGSQVELVFENNIVANNFGQGGVYFHDVLESGELSYSNFYNNQNGNFTGVIPDGLGINSQINFNGDSCDHNYNLTMDPLFANPPLNIYTLTAASPCVDAGNPAFPLDPDSTRAEMGCFFLDHNQVGVTVHLTPYGSPIQIPAGGGGFSYLLTVQNIDVTANFFDIWALAELPNGSTFGPIFLRQNLTIQGGAIITRDNMTQNVPGNAPAGEYLFIVSVGEYPQTVFSADTILFTKTGMDASAGNGSWEASGWVEQIICSTDNLKINCHPNPFNERISIEFDLPVIQDVKLKIFDITGREIQVLVTGHLSLGKHNVDWDAQGLGSGVYFVRLEAGDYVKAQKIILLK